MKKAASAVLALAMLATCGCASLLRGNNEQAMVSSDPNGADVSINGQQEGTTPYVTTTPSSRDLQIAVSKPGYKTTMIEDKADFRWGYEIWSFVEFVIPLGVDIADGGLGDMNKP